MRLKLPFNNWNSFARLLGWWRRRRKYCLHAYSLCKWSFSRYLSVAGSDLGFCPSSDPAASPHEFWQSPNPSMVRYSKKILAQGSPGRKSSFLLSYTFKILPSGALVMERRYSSKKWSELKMMKNEWKLTRLLQVPHSNHVASVSVKVCNQPFHHLILSNPLAQDGAKYA